MIPEQIADNFELLVASSAAGALVRALNPTNKDSLGNKVGQGVVGVLSAVFLGPMIGGFMESYVTDPVYAIAVSGFICGIVGIEITKGFLGKVFK